MNKLTSETRNKILSGVVAALGVATVAGLEIAFTPHTNFSQFVATSAAIAVAGLLRWYMFYEGTALGKYSQSDAKKALIMSVILAVSLFGYGVALFAIGFLGIHTFALFTITNLGLVFVEWVYGRRTSYTKPAQQLILEHQADRLIKVARSLKRKLVEKSDQVVVLLGRNDQLQEEVTRIGKDLETVKLRTSELTEIVADHEGELERIRVFEQAAKESFFMDGKEKYKICSNGHKTYLRSNNTQVLVCECGEVVYQKLESVTE